MPEIDLEPKDYRQRGPRIVSRKMAWGMVLYCLAAAVAFQWMLLRDLWWGGVPMWPPLILIGAYVTRLFPLLFVGED